MCDSEFDEAAHLERRTLTILLALNALMFVVELGAGLFANATGLLADSLDMFADASVYAIALYAVGRGRRLQASAATLSGVLQITLGLGVLVDVVRRSFTGVEPLSLAMVVVGLLALAVNATCLVLISRHRDGGVHMRASYIFSANDVLQNIGVIVSGGLVALLGSRWPDLIVGAGIAVLVVRGGLHILREAREERVACAAEPDAASEGEKPA